MRPSIRSAGLLVVTMMCACPQFRPAVRDAGTADAGVSDSGPDGGGGLDAGSSSYCLPTDGGPPITCGAVCGLCSNSPSETQSAFTVVGADPAAPSTVGSLVGQVAQTFALDSRGDPTCSGGEPGGVVLDITLNSNTQLITTDWNMLVDLIDLGPELSCEAYYSIPTQHDANGCDVPVQPIAEGIYNTRQLSWNGGPTNPRSVRINFVYAQGVTLSLGHEYALLIRMDVPGFNNIGVSGTYGAQNWYPNGHAYVRWMQVAASSPSCIPSVPFAMDRVQDVAFTMTLNDGCPIGKKIQCGIGSCFRQVDACDAYGNKTQCTPGMCRNDNDCLWNWNHPPAGDPSTWTAGAGWYGPGSCARPSTPPSPVIINNLDMG